MLRAYKYRIYPTDEQKVLFAKTFGCCRFVYNWALNLKIEAYKQEKQFRHVQGSAGPVGEGAEEEEPMAGGSKFTSPSKFHPQP